MGSLLWQMWTIHLWKWYSKFASSCWAMLAETSDTALAFSCKLKDLQNLREVWDKRKEFNLEANITLPRHTSRHSTGQVEGRRQPYLITAGFTGLRDQQHRNEHPIGNFTWGQWFCPLVAGRLTPFIPKQKMWPFRGHPAQLFDRWCRNPESCVSEAEVHPGPWKLSQKKSWKTLGFSWWLSGKLVGMPFRDYRSWS